MPVVQLMIRAPGKKSVFGTIARVRLDDCLSDDTIGPSLSREPLDVIEKRDWLTSVGLPESLGISPTPHG